ncbi:hypothetical protein ILUMI_06958, partial [Ignelater luminosus]
MTIARRENKRGKNDKISRFDEENKQDNSNIPNTIRPFRALVLPVIWRTTLTNWTHTPEISNLPFSSNYRKDAFSLPWLTPPPAAFFSAEVADPQLIQPRDQQVRVASNHATVDVLEYVIGRLEGKNSKRPSLPQSTFRKP